MRGGERRERWSGILMLGTPVLVAWAVVAVTAANHYLAGGRLETVISAIAIIALALVFAVPTVGGFFYLAGRASIAKRITLAVGCGVFGVVIYWIIATIGVIMTVGL